MIFREMEKISIHPPRVGRDRFLLGALIQRQNFNPPSPCGEGQGDDYYFKRFNRFQSTLPVWGGTPAAADVTSIKTFQSTLPVWGGTGLPVSLLLALRFQSTLPVWGGTGKRCSKRIDIGISIHPPRVGRDLTWPTTTRQQMHFNPPSPCGEGPSVAVSVSPKIEISIHPPRVGRDAGNPAVFWYRSDFNPPSPCGEGRYL